MNNIFSKHMLWNKNIHCMATTMRRMFVILLFSSFVLSCDKQNNFESKEQAQKTKVELKTIRNFIRQNEKETVLPTPKPTISFGAAVGAFCGGIISDCKRQAEKASRCARKFDAYTCKELIKDAYQICQIAEDCGKLLKM